MSTKYQLQKRTIYQRDWNDARKGFSILAINPYKRRDFRLVWDEGFLDWHNIEHRQANK